MRGKTVLTYGQGKLQLQIILDFHGTRVSANFCDEIRKARWRVHAQCMDKQFCCLLSCAGSMEYFVNPICKSC